MNLKPCDDDDSSLLPCIDREGLEKTDFSSKFKRNTTSATQPTLDHSLIKGKGSLIFDGFMFKCFLIGVVLNLVFCPPAKGQDGDLEEVEIVEDLTDFFDDKEIELIKDRLPFLYDEDLGL